MRPHLLKVSPEVTFGILLAYEAPPSHIISWIYRMKLIVFLQY